jgi:tetratricopeptide (TPR) repeat protein
MFFNLKNTKMKRILLFTIISFIISTSFAQQVKGFLEVKGSIKLEAADQEFSKIKVIQGGIVEKTYPAEASGKFSLNLDLNKIYTLEIERQGYYSKRLEFNTNVPAEDVGIWTYKFSIELIPELEGFDASLLNEPIGKINFVDKVGDFDFDEAYTTAMQKKIKVMMEEYERKKREAYERMIVKADQAYNQANYDEAIELYNKAIDLDPYDPYPDDRIEMIGRIMAKDQNKEKNYQKNIALADNYFNQTDYSNAKLYYQRALNYKDDPYPKGQITKIDQLLKDNADNAAAIAAKEKAYKEAIAIADQKYTTKEYEPSLAKYQEASAIKPAEQYPKDKIAELTQIIARLKGDLAGKEAIEKAYREAIALADNQFTQKDYINSRTNYEKAKQVKPVETYPTTRIAEIDRILTTSKSIDEKYNGYIAVADKAFTEKQYESAKSNYQQATSIKPVEAYPKQKIAEIDGILAQLAQQRSKDLEANYQKAIAQADAAFNKKDYNPAKDAYKQALTFKPNEAYPTQKITEIDRLLADIAAKKHAYDLAISRADNSFNESKWEAAKIDYQEALNLFPTEPYPQTRLNEIENRLLAQKNAAEQQKAREKAYNQAISKGDSLFKLTKYPESKNSFNQALAIKNNEVYPKNKIAEIDNLMAQQKLLDEKYAGFISTGDQLFLTSNYNEARENYVNASQLKQNETYPKQKIAEIDKLIAEAKANKEKQQLVDNQYNQVITQADAQFNAQVWEQAKGLYQQASGIKPTEVYPKQRIVEIDNMLGKIASDNQKYQQAISAGDGLFNQKKYMEALTSFNLAATIKPNEVYPKNKITEINALIELQKKADNDYDNFIMLADAAYSQKQFDNAKAQYQSALTVKPGQAYPTQRIAEIDKMLEEQRRLMAEKDRIEAQYKSLIAGADLLFSQNKYNEAKTSYSQASALKPDVMYPKEKIAEIERLIGSIADKQKAYDARMQEAASLFGLKNYNGALASYQQASQIKPDEMLPKQKITEIQNILNNEAQKKQQYNGLITQADNLFNQKNYSGAKPIYQQALVIMPGEKYPTDQINRIDQLIADAARQQADLAARVKTYQAKIVEADRLLNEKKYDQSLSAYMDAKGIKSDETYPDQQIAKINQLMQADKQRVEAAYNEAVRKGDEFLASKTYDQAKVQFTQALNLKPGEPLPQKKLIEIENLIAQDKASKERQSKIDQDYQNYITQADNAFKLKEYSSAIGLYKAAKGVKPEEKYPSQQIELCERKIQEAKALAAAEEEKRKKDELAAAQNSFSGKDFDYSGEQRDNKFLNELAKQYPEGVTTENYDKKNKKIKRVIVNHGGIAKEYIEVVYSYGTYYFRNGQNISPTVFYNETKE